MELTPDQVTDLILTAFEKGIARGRELASAESGEARVFVRQGTFIMGVDPTVAPFGSSPLHVVRNAPECAHNATTKAVNGPTVCNVCGREIDSSIPDATGGDFI